MCPATQAARSRLVYREREGGGERELGGWVRETEKMNEKSNREKDRK